MIRKSKTISINILSVSIILICLLLSCVGYTNAWFTSNKQDGVKIIVEVGSLKLNLYQNIGGENVRILSNKDDPDANANQYIVLNEDDGISPDEEINVTLIIANDDTASASMYLRYKFEVYIHGTTSDTLLNSTIADYLPQTEEQKGFAPGGDGYYYYRDEAGENALFKKGTSATIMESFTIPYEEFIEADGSLKLVNSDTIYVKLIIDASSSSTFSA